MTEAERIGLLGELLTQYRLAEFGVKSFVCNQPDYDILAESPNGFFSIQVKTRSRPSDERGNVTFRVHREQDRHMSRGQWVPYNCDFFAFVYLPAQCVLFIENGLSVSGGFHVNQFTQQMSALSAKACGFAKTTLHARGARNNITETAQSSFDLDQDL